MPHFNWRTASRAAATVMSASAVFAGTAAAQTTPAPTTPIEIPTTGAPIAPNGTDGAPTPGTNECFARLFKPKDVPQGYDVEGSIAVQYRLRCSSDVSGYSFSFNREVQAAETEVFPTLYTSNSVIPDESFSCQGDFPGLGVNCVGTYKGRFSTIRGIVSLALTDQEVQDKTPFCKLGLSAAASTFTSLIARDPYTNKPLVNKDGTSQIRLYGAGPFKVTLPGCHRGASAEASKKKKPAKTTAKSARS